MLTTYLRVHELSRADGVLVLAQRGVGTMAAMVMVGQLMRLYRYRGPDRIGLGTKGSPSPSDDRLPTLDVSGPPLVPPV